MADIRVELHKKNASNGFDRLLVATDIHSVRGLLNDDDKISSLWLPSYIVGGMRYTAGISFTTNHKFSDFWEKVGLQTLLDNEGQNLAGRYFIAGTAINDFQLDSFIVQYGAPSPISFDVAYDTTSIAEEDISGNTLLLEAGDWLVISKVEILEPVGGAQAGTLRLKLEIVNNTYRDATTAAKGIVHLANDITTSDYGVITGSLLFDKMPSLITTHHPTSGITAGSGNYFTVNAQGHITAKEMRNASETVSGFIEIATTAEMQVDTNDALAMTPKKTKQAIDWWGGLRYYAALPSVADIAEGCIVAVLKS